MLLATNEIIGTANDDVLYGTVEADVIDGNGGIDRVSYVESDLGVIASLLTGTGTGGYAEGDTYAGILNLEGSRYDDVLTGNGAGNVLEGRGGRDRLNGRAGDDVLSGGNGNDILVGGAGADINIGGEGSRDAIDFSRAKAAVALSLEHGMGWQGEAEGDLYFDIEYIYGSAFDDAITGDSEINRLIGNDGNDVIDAGRGNDYILGGAGTDTMTGGGGKDVFVIEAGFAGDTITDFKAGTGYTDRIWLQGVGFDDFGDVLASALDTVTGLVIDIAGHGTLTLDNVFKAQLAADDFLFG